MLKSIPVLIASLFVSFVTVGCGRSYEEHEVKEYRLAVDSTDVTIQQLFSGLIDTYNNDAGFKALTYVSAGASSNSQIILTPGLNARDGKIGWGQWIKNIEEDSPNALATDTPVRTVHYTMRLELDADYVKTRMNATETDKRYELFKLFAHEVGHGFMMNHDPDPKSVMYYEVSGNKDFPTYFQRVRTFFAE